jgi:hypothetical protein
VIDVFYLTAGGRKLDEAAQAALSKSLTQRLENLRH